MATIQMSFQRGELFRPQHALRLRVLKGSLWLTRKGELEDRILEPGDLLRLHPSQLPIVEALSPQVLVKVDEAPGLLGWLGRISAAPQPRLGVLRGIA